MPLKEGEVRVRLLGRFRSVLMGLACKEEMGLS